MATITPSVAPGAFLDHQTIGFSFSPDVTSVAITTGNAPPSISKYIAYDTLTPANPFIAVTEDGRGRVVYDGGFPKFYNMSAPPAGINDSITMEFSATCTGGYEGSNLFYYNAFSDQHVTIAEGDKFVYDLFQNSADSRCALDAITAAGPETPGIYSMRDWGGKWLDGIENLRDQNGYPPHPAVDLEGQAVNQWYHREIDLTPCTGHTFIRWSMAYEGEIAGDFYTRFRDVYVIDKNGVVKATLFKDKIDLPANSSTESDASGYINLTKTIYDPRAQLSAPLKYLYNSIQWVSNRDKLSGGNRRILILSDSTVAQAYSVKNDIRADGFKLTFDRLTAVMGLQPSYIDYSDYTDAILNPVLGFLEQFICVVFMGVGQDQGLRITPGAINDLVTYRENGGGIIMITDHGPVHSSIEAAGSITQSGFFRHVNLLATRFGAYFTGTFDRTPVSVGFLRSTYGDHPLYSGMTDQELVPAGGSESRVVVSSTTLYAPNAVPQITTTVNGITYINILAIDVQGNLTTARLSYNVAGDEILFVESWHNGQTVINTAVNTEISGKMILNVTTSGASLGTVWGEILLNGKRIGAFLETGGVKRFTLYASHQVRAKVGDVLEVKMVNPFSYSKTFVVGSRLPDLTGVLSQARISRLLSDSGIIGTFSNTVNATMDEINRTANNMFEPLSLNNKLNIIRSARANALTSAESTTCALFGNDAAGINAISVNADSMLNHVINYNSGALIAWKDGAVRVTGTFAKDIYPADQVFISNGDPGQWRMNAAGIFTKIA